MGDAESGRRNLDVMGSKQSRMRAPCSERERSERSVLSPRVFSPEDVGVSEGTEMSTYSGVRPTDLTRSKALNTEEEGDRPGEDTPVRPHRPLGGGGGRRQAGSAVTSHLLSEVIAVFPRPEQTLEITQHVFLHISVFPSRAPSVTCVPVQG